MSADHNVNILVVDDLQEKLLVYQSILEEPGQTVVLARSGDDALRHLLQDEFAVILLDVNMPGMDGFETAAMIRRRKRSAHTPIIFITAFADELHALKGYSYGAVDYILAPVSPDVLRTKVRVFVQLFRFNREQQERNARRIAVAEQEGARLRAVLDKSSDLFARTDVHGRVMELNGGGASMLGCEPSPNHGLSYAKCHADSEEAGQDDRLLTAAREGIWFGESTLRHRDGREVPVAEILLAHKNDDGEVESFSLIARDMTERKQAERARALLAAIVESSDDAMISKTLDGRITSWNAGAQRIFGFTADEAVGQPITMLIPPDRHDEEKEILRCLSRGERIEPFETVRVAKDGRAIDMSLTISPLRDGEGRIIGASKVARDITERKRTEAELAMHRAHLEELVEERTSELHQTWERLRLADRLASIGTLAAGLGHDMGNLLLPIRMRLESLEQHKLAKTARNDIDAIKTAMEYLRRLSQGLRLFSLDPETVRKEGDVTHLHRWWQEVEPFLRNALPRTIVLKSSLHVSLPPVAMAPHVFTQVVYNLVQNAGDVMKSQPAGSVDIRAEVINEGRAIAISVADNGPGMTDEVKRRCMEPFFTTKPRGISTGFGLALVRGAVLKASGAVEVYSQPCKGTEIRLVLPTLTDDVQALDMPVDRMRMAHLSLGDGQMRAYVASVLRSLRFEIAHGPWPVHTEAELLVIDGNHRAREELEAFLTGDPNRHVVVFGGDQAISATTQLTIVEAKPSPARIREALRMAARGQPLQHATL